MSSSPNGVVMSTVGDGVSETGPPALAVGFGVCKPGPAEFEAFDTRLVCGGVSVGASSRFDGTSKLLSFKLSLPAPARLLGYRGALAYRGAAETERGSQSATQVLPLRNQANQLPEAKTTIAPKTAHNFTAPMWRPSRLAGGLSEARDDCAVASLAAIASFAPIARVEVRSTLSRTFLSWLRTKAANELFGYACRNAWNALLLPASCVALKASSSPWVSWARCPRVAFRPTRSSMARSSV